MAGGIFQNLVMMAVVVAPFVITIVMGILPGDHVVMMSPAVETMAIGAIAVAVSDGNITDVGIE